MNNHQKKPFLIGAVILGGLMVSALLLFLLSRLDIFQDGQTSAESSETPSEEPIEEDSDSSVYYSFLDTEDMTEEELAALEERLQEDQKTAFDPSFDTFSVATSYQYHNSVVRCTLPSGSELIIGSSAASGANDAEEEGLLLSPVFLPSTEDLSDSDGQFLDLDTLGFGLYLTSDLPTDLTYASEEMLSYEQIYQDNSSQGAGEGAEPITFSTYLITDRTYDTLILSVDGWDAIYPENSEATTGVVWQDSQTEPGTRTVGIRIVRFPDGALVGCLRLTIGYDEEENAYSYASLEYTDVRETGELTAEETDTLIEDCMDFICATDQGQALSLDRSLLEENKEAVLVEKVDSPYFSRLFSHVGEVTAAASYEGMDLYAVNFYYPELGCITVYAAPERQIWGLRSSVAANEDLTPCGFDAMNPFTADSLYVPAELSRDFYDEFRATGE